MGVKKGNNFVVDETTGTARVELARKDGENLWTTIDLEDLDRVINYPHTWFAKYSPTINDFYAAVNVYDPTHKYNGTLHLHQFVMGVRHDHVDHINHDPRDNRKENLRVASPSQNYRNRDGKNRNNTSGYRNVSWSARENKWLVQLQIGGKNRCLKKFAKEELDEAGKFAAEMRQKYYGEFAGCD